MAISLQTKRLLTRTGFFLLFLFAPALDLFRFDLTTTQFVVFGARLSFGLTPDWISQASALDAGVRILTRFLIPLILVIGAGLYIFWRWGRIYCGWLCPHFSVVEVINGLMLRVLDRVTLWEPARQARPVYHRAAGGLIVLCVSMLVAFTWAVALLTYLMPPMPLYEQIITLTVPWKQSLFIGVATLVFTVDFVMARHLFCRYGCAVGLFQSLLWMMNTKAIVVSFDHQRANLCKGCDKDCEDACPMRLSVRGYKRAKFTCTQCAQCISACQHVQRGNPEGSLLNWTPGEQIKQVSLIPLKDVTSVKPKTIQTRYSQNIDDRENAQ